MRLDAGFSTSFLKFTSSTFSNKFLARNARRFNLERGRGVSYRFPWHTLSDEHLLDMRICDLQIKIKGSFLEPHIKRLYSELNERGIRFKPHVWLSEEWFSPDGVPGIAIPFYLAHPRLMKLERKQMLEVEGGTDTECMRILRHEAGHALDTAFRLHFKAALARTLRFLRSTLSRFLQAQTQEPQLCFAPARVVCAGTSRRRLCRNVCRLADARVRAGDAVTKAGRHCASLNTSTS